MLLSFRHMWSISIMPYARAFLAAVFYLSFALSGLVLFQLLRRGSTPTQLITLFQLLGNIVLFYAPVVISVGTLWALVWVAYHWKLSEIPLFLELNGTPKYRLLWTVQPFVIANCLLLFLMLHNLSPSAGSRLHTQARQTISSQIPVSQIQKWGELTLGAQSYAKGEFKDVFFATKDVAGRSALGQADATGALILERGVVRDISGSEDWSLEFGRARIQRVQSGISWSVHMLNSERLIQKIDEDSKPEALRRELYKRSAQPFGLWMLGMSLIVLTLRGWAIGVTLSGGLLSWWMIMRFFDHQINVLGAMGSAFGPVGIQFLVLCVCLWRWRVR